MPKGSWTLEYTIRLNNEGTFILPETTVEALYAPEMFGIIPNGRIEIKRENSAVMRRHGGFALRAAVIIPAGYSLTIPSGIDSSGSVPSATALSVP